MDKKERLAKAIAYLKLNGLADSQADAARKMNAAESTMSSAISGNERYLNNRFLKRFNDAFGGIFSLNWLINGVGSMLCGYKDNSDPNTPFMLSEPEPTPPEPNLRNRINFLEQQLKLEQQKNELLQQQLNLYENRV